MNQDTDIRTHVILPRDVVQTIDRLVGQRGRSRFLLEAARRELAHRELLEVARAAMGSGRGQDRPWGTTSESIAAWVREGRAEGDERDAALDAGRARRPATS